MKDAVLERVVPAQFPEVGTVRRATGEFLRQDPDDFRETLLLVVSELATNAVEALGSDPNKSFTLRVKDFPDRVEIEIEDAGPGFTKALHRPGSDDANPRGRGLHVVQSLVDEFTVRRRGGRTTVCCKLYRR